MLDLNPFFYYNNAWYENMKILILLLYIGLKRIKEVDINENDIPTKKEI
jgi:hypothetical protein